MTSDRRLKGSHLAILSSIRVRCASCYISKLSRSISLTSKHALAPLDILSSSRRSPTLALHVSASLRGLTWHRGVLSDSPSPYHCLSSHSLEAAVPLHCIIESSLRNSAFFHLLASSFIFSQRCPVASSTSLLLSKLTRGSQVSFDVRNA